MSLTVTQQTDQRGGWTSTTAPTSRSASSTAGGVRRTAPMIEAPMIASMLRRLLARLSRSGEPGPAGAASAGMFRSLSNRNYRLWEAGAFVSNVGT
jgi:hypothetical protein